MTATLFSHLAERFVVQRENLATEGLAFILAGSSAARMALLEHARSLGAELPQDLSFRTQAGGADGAIPDLVGEDGAGRQLLIFEAKFWAGLTEAQPVSYLRRLLGERQGTLLFLAPALRLDTLWRELTRRCSAEEPPLTLEELTVGAQEQRVARVNGDVVFGVITWRSLLARLSMAVEAAGEARVVSDIAQLEGLCQREDAEAFLPVTSTELTGASGRRVMDFSNLVDDLTSRLVDAELADVKGLRAAAGKGWYGKYMRLTGVPSLLQFNADYWGGRAYTPLWLRVSGRNWKPDEAIAALLQSKAQAEGMLAFAGPQGTEIPIRIPAGVERDEVLAAAVTQVRQVAGWLLDADLATGVEDTPPSGDFEGDAIEKDVSV